MRKEAFLKVKLSSWVIVLLLIFLMGTAALVFILHRQQARVNSALAVLQYSSRPVQLVENTLGLLYQSEIDFREYTLTYDKTHLQHYRANVSALRSHIDTLMSISSSGDSKSGNTIGQKLGLRNEETNNILKINRLLDSLMLVVSVFDSVPLQRQDENILFRSFTIEDSRINLDTINISSTVTTTKKKGLFGKLKSFLVGEKETKQQVSTTKTVVKTGTATKADTVNTPVNNIRTLANLIIDRGNSFYKNQVKEIVHNRMEQKAAEQRLIRVNTSLMAQIKEMLDNLQAGFKTDDTQLRTQSAVSINRSASLLHNLLLITITGVFVLALIVVYMLRKTSIANEKIKISEQRAVKDAAGKGRFLSYVSHEVRSPVSLVLGYAEQLEQTELSPAQSHFVEQLRASSRMLLSTVNDILDLSAFEAGKLTFLDEPFDLAAVVRRSVMVFEQQANQKQLTLYCQVSEKQIYVSGDPMRLQQVVTNLMSNAVKYTKQGSMTVRGSFEPSGGKIQLSLEVSDTGIGIPEDKLGQVFDEYKRVHDISASNWIVGSGLGLSITRLLVEAMGGNIRVESRLGEGTKITVQLPFKVYSGAVSKYRTPSGYSSVLPPGLRILVVDDDDLNAALLKTVFEKEDVIIDFAENGQAALNKLSVGPVDIVLTDRYMPVMDGLTLTRKIREHVDPEIKNLPVILISGELSPEVTAEIDKTGISGVLLKPYKQQDLFDLIIKYTAK